jgi:hypothetical protein
MVRRKNQTLFEHVWRFGPAPVGSHPQEAAGHGYMIALPVEPVADEQPLLIMTNGSHST